MELAVPSFVPTPGRRLPGTDRFGPVDTLPWIPTEVTAHRHKVMPRGDRFRSIQIGVDLIATIAALETRLIRTSANMQTTRTGPGCVPWVNIYDFDAGARSLVINHPLQLGETPFVDASRLAVLPNPAQVFQDNALIAPPRISHDLFANTVIGVRDETPLTARDSRERPFGALAAVGLERSPRPFVAVFFVSDILRRVEPAVRRHSHAAPSKIDAQTALWLLDLRRRDRNRNMQVEAPLAIDQFRGAGFTPLKLFAHPGRHPQSAGDPAFGADRQRDALTVGTKSHRSGIVPKGRMPFELMPPGRVAHAGGADFCDRVDHMLRGEVRLLANQAVAGMMDVILAAQVLLEREFGKGVASPVELFHRGLQLSPRFWRNNEFSFDGESNFHAPNIQ